MKNRRIASSQSLRSLRGVLAAGGLVCVGALWGCAASVQNECESTSCDAICRNAGYVNGYCGIDKVCHCTYDIHGNSNWNPWAVPDGGDACEGACMARQMCCDGECKSVEFDPDHCGLCGRKCGEGESCVHGWCQCGEMGKCIEALEKCCDGQCVNIQYDPTNCGDCGVACQADTGPECVDGECVCPNLTANPRACEGTYEDMCCERTFLAGGGCFNLRNDREHCGSCERTCPVFEGSICVLGNCTQ